MKKHRLEKFLSSVFGTHIDPENNEVLEEKKGIEKNVEKILKLINAEEKDTESSGDTNDGSELRSLINDFYERYQALYGRYDHLIGKLKRKVHHKSGTNGSFSFNFTSSDSESSDSETNGFSNNEAKHNKTREGKLGEGISVEDYRALQGLFENMKIRNVELETKAMMMLSKLKGAENLAAEQEESETVFLALEKELQNMSESFKVLQVENEDLKQELETSNQQQSYTNQRLRSIKEENETLMSEKSMALNSLQETVKSVEEYKTEAEQLKGVISKLHNENDNLKKELEITSQELVDLNLQLTSKNEEKDALILENSTVLSKLQQAEKDRENLRNEADLMKLSTEKLLSENALLLLENTNLKHELEAANQQRADLIQRLATVEEENGTLNSEILKSGRQIEMSDKTIKELSTQYELSKDEKSKLLDINEALNEEMRVKDDERRALSLEHAEAVDMVRKFHENIEMFSVQVDRLKDENSVLGFNNEGLKQELEGANSEASELKRKLELSQEEKQKLAAENLAGLSKIQQAEKMKDDFKTEIEQLKSDNSKLQAKVDDLVCDLEAVNLHFADLNNALRVSEEEKNTLTSENLVLLSKMAQVEKNVKELENDLERLREENSVLQQNQTDLQCQNSDMGRKLEEKVIELFALQKELGEVQNEASSEIQTKIAHANDLQQELDLLSVQKNKLEEEIKTLTQKASENQNLMEKLEAELNSKVYIQEKMLREQKESFDELFANHKLLEDQFKELCRKLEISQEKIKEIESKDKTIVSLSKVDEEQKREISRLEESHREVSEKLKLSEAEKSDIDKEAAKLHGQVQTLEVQLRLSNQKLKITETEQKEKEENHKRTVETLREECRKLEEQKVTLSGKMALMVKDVRKIKEVLVTGMETLSDRINGLELVVEENCGHIKTKLSECSEQLKMVKTWLAALVHGKLELEREKHELAVRLKYKEGIISMSKEEAGILGTKLAAKSKEEERLMGMVVKSEKKIEELEKRVKDKEVEVLSKNEEKREAIRQLCLLIEYHRENCNHLYQFLSATNKRSRR